MPHFTTLGYVPMVVQQPLCIPKLVCTFGKNSSVNTSILCENQEICPETDLQNNQLISIHCIHSNMTILSQQLNLEIILPTAQAEIFQDILYTTINFTL